jgi:hypothetical protein
MHQFYSQEARHQRTMMWETVKWFTPILTVIAGGWYTFFINKFLPNSCISYACILIALALMGTTLTVLCIFLLRSFYKTNLKYITMFAKVEEELNFDSRAPDKAYEFYPSDVYFTWEGYRAERKGEKPNKEYESMDYGRMDGRSEKAVKIQLKDSIRIAEDKSIYILMKWVFYLFGLSFYLSSLIVFWMGFHWLVSIIVLIASAIFIKRYFFAIIQP